MIASLLHFAIEMTKNYPNLMGYTLAPTLLQAKLLDGWSIVEPITDVHLIH